MNKDTNSERIVNTITGNWEKRNLPKMAKALPVWVMPDHLTLLGIMASTIIAAGYILSNLSGWWLLLSNLGLFIHWFADSLDGTLARVRHIERENYGYFVDHMCDVWTVILMCLGLGMSPLMQMEIAMFLAVGYLMINVYVHITVYTRRIFVLSYSRFGPTEIRIIIIILNFVLIFWNPVILYFRKMPLSFFDLMGIAASIIFLLIFITRFFKEAKELYHLDDGKLAKISV